MVEFCRSQQNIRLCITLFRFFFSPLDKMHSLSPAHSQMHILFGWIWIWKIDQGWHKLNAIKIRMQLFNSVGISIRVSKYTLKVLWNWIPFLCVCEHLNSGFSLNWCIQGNFISKTIYMTKPFDFLLLLCLKQKQGTQPKWQMRQTSNKTKTKFFHYTLETHTQKHTMREWVS